MGAGLHLGHHVHAEGVDDEAYLFLLLGLRLRNVAHAGLAYETDLVASTFMPIIYHCGHNSMPLPTFLAGGKIVLGHRPDAVQMARAVTAERVTAAWLGSPLWVEKLVSAAEAYPSGVDLHSLTVAMFSWGAMRPDLGDRLTAVCGAQVQMQMLEVFGQTESTSCFRFWPSRHPDRHQESLRGTNHVGVPTPILAADIHDAEGRSLRGRPGIPGEAVYRSPSSPPATIATRRRRPTPSAAAGSTRATHANSRTTARRSWSTASRTS